MRRAWVVSVVMVGLMVAALSALGPGLWSGHIDARWIPATLTLFVIGGIGIIACVDGALDHRRFVRRLNGLTEVGEVEGLIGGSRDWRPLERAIGRVTGLLRRDADQARTQAREMELQYKVASAQRQHAQAILLSISDAVLVTNNFDELVMANEAAARIFDFDASTATGRAILEVVKDRRIIELIRDVRASASGNTRRIVEHTLGEERAARTYKLTLSAMTDISDQPSGVVAVFHDMTREKEVAQMKTDFVSNVSHELRTPLASIKAYVEMLVDGEADDETTRREFYDIIQNEANRLGRLIDNILNISRIESGLVKVNKQPISPAVVMKDALEVIGPQAKSRNIRLEERLTPVMHQTVADRDMLYQALLNLLSNAVKYTPEGGTVRAEVAVDEAAHRVTLRISDTGAGISPKDLPFVFDKFYRVSANNHMAKGTGLGLSLVRHIVENVHHGQIHVESEPGKGSTFSFELELT